MITAHECSVNYQRYSFTKFSQRWIFMIITITTSFMEWSILFVTDSYPVHSGILNKAFKEVPVSTIIHRFIMLNLSFAGEVFKSWIGHFRVPLGLCFKTRVGAQPLIWKSFFIFMQIKLIFTRKVVHLASFWKWGFLELASGLFGPPCKGLQDIFRFWIPCRRFRTDFAPSVWTFCRWVVDVPPRQTSLSDDERRETSAVRRLGFWMPQAKFSRIPLHDEIEF